MAGARGTWSCSQAGVFTGVGNELRPFCVPPFRATAIAYLPDDGLLIAGGEPGRSGMIARYDRTGALVAQCRVAEDLVYALYCGGGSALVACADGRVLSVPIDDLGKSRVVHTHSGPARAVLVTRLDHGPVLIVSGGRDARILVTPAEGGPTLAIVDHTGGVECLDVTTHIVPTVLYSGSRDGKVRVHELYGDGTARLARTWQRLGAPVLALCARRPGSPPDAPDLIAGLANGELRATDDKHELVAIDHLPTAITALAVGDHGEILAGLDGEVRVMTGHR